MEKPEVKERLSGWDFIWQEFKLMIRVSKIAIRRTDEGVKGEIEVFSLADNGEEICVYPPTNTNFTSERDRTSKENSLIKLLEELPWKDIIAQLCSGVIVRARKGEPVRELWTSEDVAPPEWLLKPILYRNLPTIVFGEKAACKSTLSLAVYACLTLPWEDNPLGWQAPKREVRTLLADYEVDYDVAHYNLKRLAEGMDIGPLRLNYRRCALPLADDLEQLQLHMASMNAEALIVDSLGPAVGGDLKDPAQALRFTSALRRLHCSTLIIGQTRRPEKNDDTGRPKSVYGSTFFEYYARNIFELRKVQEEEEDELDVALFNTYHNLGRRYKPQGFHLNFNGTGTHIIKQAITAPDLIERMGTQSRILDLLKSGKMSTGDIAEAMSKKEGNIRQTCSVLKAKGLIVKLPDGWGLAIKEEKRQ